MSIARILTAKSTGVLVALILCGGLGAESVEAQVRAQAVSGSPFGVGRITVPAGSLNSSDAWADGSIDLVEKNGRALYPVYSTGPVRRLIREFAPIDLPRIVTIYFLFQGSEPLDLTIYAPKPVTVRVRPQAARGRLQANMKNLWWQEYSRAAARRGRSNDYPSQVDTYLTTTLARRMSLGAAEITSDSSNADPTAQLLGSEDLYERVLRDVASGRNTPGDKADTPLPASGAPPAIQYTDSSGDVKIEPIAMRVPVECFYLRAGTWNNYVWMRQTSEQWGGDLRNLISERGLDYRINALMERQLGLRETELSRKLGGTLISDVAIIGNDFFFREGAAMGILFEARNNFLLSTNLMQQRNEAAAREGKKAASRQVKIAGRVVHYVSTPNGRLRSYYLAEGDYHLVTTSPALVKRFLEASKGIGSLGKSQEFKHARSRMPLSRNDTLFAYLSDAMFRNLASPRYKIETHRRLRSLAEIDTLRMARLAAQAEKSPAKTIDELIAAGFLPTGFGTRADGSKLVEGKHQLYDSLRGLPGSYLAIPDMPLEKVSAAEARQYSEFARAHRSSTALMTPLIAAVKRTATKQPGVERIRLHVELSPPPQPMIQWLARWSGPPSKQRVAPLPSDLVRIDAIGPAGNFLFLGLQEFNPPVTIRNGRIETGMPTLQMSRGYLGGSPDLGRIQPLINLLAGQPARSNVPGYTRTLIGLWQWRNNAMSVVSFHHDILARVVPQLKFVEEKRPAQLRVKVVDLSRTKLGPAINAHGFSRARNVSVGNTGLMHSLSRQLHVPREDCLKLAQKLARARLMCSLGGEYKLADGQGGQQVWTSSAWSGPNRFALTEIPASYTTPTMQWFRGINVEAIAKPELLVARVELLMQTKKQDGTWLIPEYRPIEVPRPEAEPKAEEELPVPVPDPLPEPKKKPEGKVT